MKISTVKKDNKSATSVRSTNRSHGQNGDMISAIRDAVLRTPGFDWRNKYNLVNEMKSKYPEASIGEINHQIEKAMRNLQQDKGQS
jgi:hypothetical protein